MGCPSEVIIGDNLVFSVTTHDPDTGVVTDADAVPAYRIYEDETLTAILSGTMALFVDAGGAGNTTGFYTESIAATAGNGFEDGKTYTIYIEATVDSDKGAISYGFKAAAAKVTAAKHLAYVQLMTRADEAIETDNAVEMAEINADEGSGAGGYKNDQESLEAILERGNQAWLTGAGAGATESYTEDTNWTRTVGDNDGGAASDTVSVDGVSFVTGETGSGVYLQVDAVFTITAGETASVLDVWGRYAGGAGHSIQVLALDTASSLYEPVGSMSNDSTIDKHSFGLSPGHTNGTAVTIRFLHQGGVGIASHALHVDKAQVSTITPATPAPSAASIADAVWDELQAGHVDVGSFGLYLDASVAAIPTTPMRGTDNAATEAKQDIIDTNLDALIVTVGDAGAGLTDLGGMSAAMKAEVNAEVDTALSDYDGPTNLEMEARTLPWADYFDPAADTVAQVTLVDTTTDVTNGVTLTVAERNATADALLVRDMDQVEATAPEHSLCTTVLAMLESSVAGTTWTIKRTDGSTTHATKTVTVDASADPITGVT